MAKQPLSILPPGNEASAATDSHGDVSSTVAALNRTVHEPARLAILSVLRACDAADFVFLRIATGLTAGNLSVQLSRLEEAGLIELEKTIEQRRTLTMVRLASEGRLELDRYWQDMDRLRQQVRIGTATETGQEHLPGSTPATPAGACSRLCGCVASVQEVLCSFRSR